MSQSSFLQLGVPAKMRLAAVVTTSLLTMLTTTFMPALQAEDAAASSNRRVFATYDVHENLPTGTRVARLLDHNLTLKNFRIAEPQDSAVFTVDAHDGSVCINRDDQLDFERQRRIRLLVLADEDLAEQDHFLEEFSAGLLEDGLPTSAFRSLSTGTVTIDITIQVRDVPEPPELLDANLAVQLLDDSETAFGTVAAFNRQSNENLHYFIASGDEDDVFRINTDTGALSLRGAAARHFDMISTHELVILAENPAGLSATANVVVSVFNETPQLRPMPVTAQASIPGENSTRSNTQHIAVTSTDANSVITRPAGPILNLDTIDVVEVGNWLAATDAIEDIDSKPADVSPATKTESTPSPLPAAKVQSASQGILLSLLALIVFVMSCIAAAVTLSRASAARKAVLQEKTAKPAVNPSLPLKAESDHKVRSIQTTIQSPESDAAADQAGLIRQLQDQLASRDRLIEQLKNKLYAFNRGCNKSTVSGDQTDYEESVDSFDNFATPAAPDRQPKHNATLQPQISQDSKSQPDVRSGLMTAHERLERELIGNTPTLIACNSNAASAAGLVYEPGASAVETLDESENLRSELADLFATQAVEENEFTARRSEVGVDPATAESEDTDQEAEDSHLDSIQRYLSQLLERSPDATSPDDILLDRRKTNDQNRGSDRRPTPEPARKPVKSFLDSYMEKHGGELAGDPDSNHERTPADKAENPLLPAKPRTPVDVKSIRESMNSFRAVAIQSVENAVLSHDRRQAKGKVAVRTMLIAGLIAVTILVFFANLMQAIQFSMLNWLMVTCVALALIELCLRIHSIRRQRKSRTAAAFKPRSATHSVGRSDDCDTLVES